VPHASRLRRASQFVAREPVRYLRQAGRLPLELQAEARIKSQTSYELADLVGDIAEVPITLAHANSRHAWSLGAAEQLIIQVLLIARGCQTVFEIGTFNGGTTRMLAEALPDDGQVVTIDLDPGSFDASQAPAAFRGAQVGEAYRDSPAAHKITQLLGDSLEYDFSEHFETADFVLVDAGHEYPNGLADTKTALQLLKPGGLILWDDYTPYWHGLVNGICDAMVGRSFGPIAGTSLAVYVDDRTEAAGAAL
jgi:predicted O-methyltransferase YrrM